MWITGTITCKAKSEAKHFSTLRGLQVDFSPLHSLQVDFSPLRGLQVDFSPLRSLQVDFSLPPEDQRAGTTETGTDLQTT